MHCRSPSNQMPGRDQSDQSVVMIAMEMADKYMSDFIGFYPELLKNHLGTFATINQKVLFAVSYKLCAEVSGSGWNGSTATQYCDCELLHNIQMIQFFAEPEKSGYSSQI